MEIPGYEIKGPLGRGGMGTVYLAFQLSLQREVAIKVMAPALAVDEEFSRRFLNEGRVIARLSHPNIVTVYDIGIHEHRHYLSMEYLPGGTLKRRIVEGITLSESLRVIKTIAGALGYAHRAGFVHRDVKPQNILFRGDGTPVLTDFGIAKSVGASSVMTVTGASVGSPKYMSPEQARGQRVDSRSDLYALGVIFYEMLTGRLPYETEDPFAVALMHVSEPIPRLPDLYAPFQPVIDCLMAKAAEQRYPDAEQFVAALTALEQSLLPGDTVEMTAVMPGTVLWDAEDRTPEGRTPEGRTPEDRIPTMPNPEPSAAKPRDGTGGVPPMAPGGAAAQAAASPETAAAPPLVPVEPTIYRATPPPPVRRRFGGHRTTLLLGAVLALAPAVYLAGRLLPGQGEPAGAETRSLPTPAAPADGDALQALLARAERQRRDGRLLEPAGDNAADSYRQALALAPADAAAREGLRDLARQFREQAQALREQNRFGPALEQVALGLSLGADLAGDQQLLLLELEEALRTDLAEQEQAQQEAAQQRELAELLARAERQRRDGRLISPEEDNALVSYRQVLERDPENPQALAGLAELADAYRRQGEEWLQRDDRRAALAVVEQGLTVAPGDPRLLALRERALVEPGPAVRKMAAPPAAGGLDPAQTLPGVAAAQELAGQTLEPAGDNARESYLAVLELDPDNAAARAALARLSAAPAARQPAGSGATGEGTGDGVSPERPADPAAEPTEPGPAPAGTGPDGDAGRQAQIAALQKRFDALVKSWNLTSGRNGHALGVLREIQKLDPRHPFIPEGRRRIALAYAALARSALGKGQLARAERWLDAGERIQPGLSQLRSLRTELAEAEVAARSPEPEPAPAPKPPPPPRRESFNDIFQPNSNR